MVVLDGYRLLLYIKMFTIIYLAKVCYTFFHSCTQNTKIRIIFPATNLRILLASTGPAHQKVR